MFFDAIQKALASLGCNPGKIDGDIGPKTIEAIKKVQATAGQPQTGILDPATVKLIEPHTGEAALTMRLGLACQQIIENYETLYDGDPTTVQLDPYICPAGIVTIAWGHAVLDEQGNQISVKQYGVEGAIAMGKRHVLRVFGSSGITKDQASQLEAADISHFSAGVLKILGPIKVTQQQFDAFGSTSFNIGLEGFKTSSIIRLHAAGTKPVPGLDAKTLKKNSVERVPIKTMEDAFCAWSRVSGVWTLGLFRRRFTETSLYIGGASNIAPAIKAMSQFH